MEFIDIVWGQILLPVGRIVFFIILGLFVANLIESLNWAHKLAALARPLIRLGNLSDRTGAAFSVAFFSGVSANTMLAEAFDQDLMSKKELVLANLFNSLPRFFLHLPTVFFLTAPLIKGAAFLYVGVTFSAALFQTMIVIIAGRILLPSVPADHCAHEKSPDLSRLRGGKRINFRQAVGKSAKRLKKRIRKILLYMVPVYTIFVLLSHFGIFAGLEEYIAHNAWFLSWLNPQSLGIVILHVTTEFSAGLSAASVLLANNSLSYREVVLALLVGNLLSTPIRAIRHQLPYYTGIYSPRLAAELVTISQLFRGLCVILAGLVFYLVSG